MKYREVIDIYSEHRTKHLNTLLGQNVQVISPKVDDTHSKHCALKVKFTRNKPEID
jgi:chemotaxis protein CheY-P-specific phosphatase CheC